MEPREEDLKQALRDLNGAAKGHVPPNPLLEPLARIASYWWVELLLGVFWVVIALVVLKFNHASVTTVGVFTGIMFLVFAAQEFLLAFYRPGAAGGYGRSFGRAADSRRDRLSDSPPDVRRLADTSGFVFLLIGVMWMVQCLRRSERSTTCGG